MYNEYGSRFGVEYGCVGGTEESRKELINKIKEINGEAIDIWSQHWYVVTREIDPDEPGTEFVGRWKETFIRSSY
jgi:hypothetical protein